MSTGQARNTKVYGYELMQPRLRQRPLLLNKDPSCEGGLARRDEHCCNRHRYDYLHKTYLDVRDNVATRDLAGSWTNAKSGKLTVEE